MATTTGHPGRILIVLAVLVAGLIGLMAVSGTWTPKLGLDLQGGTTITLTPGTRPAPGPWIPRVCSSPRPSFRAGLTALVSASPRSPHPATIRSS